MHIVHGKLQVLRMGIRAAEQKALTLFFGKEGIERAIEKAIAAFMIEYVQGDLDDAQNIIQEKIDAERDAQKPAPGQRRHLAQQRKDIKGKIGYDGVRI